MVVWSKKLRREYQTSRCAVSDINGDLLRSSLIRGKGLPIAHILKLLTTRNFDCAAIAKADDDDGLPIIHLKLEVRHRR